MAGAKEKANIASIFKTKDPSGTVALCAEQFAGKVCKGRFSRVSSIFTEVGERYDGIDKL